jgi:acetyl-CoA carboxylase biotin carboxylase subunit
MAIETLLIANRGEIAVRIIRAAHELGIRAALAHSEADADSLAAHMADETVEIGPPQAAKSYLKIDAVLEAARKVGADAVHPGYGFLAENADFADAVEAAGMAFVGPTGDSIRLLGDKVAARDIAAKAGVPTVPGSQGRIDDLDTARDLAAEIGFPIMIKAAAGGGGRGIRVVANQAEFDHQAPQASVEARSAFGDGGLYLERFIEDARHIEVQVLGDGERVVHCFERECSLQRRRQKVWEEAPAAGLSDGGRQTLCAAAVTLAGHVGYRGAGTLEFLYDDKSHEFYFIEMNTRIQVEHPVTEAVTGIDLVREMIRIAGGEKLRLRQEDIHISGHAIECRINAEDPTDNFMPNLGVIDELAVPGGPGVRFDTMLYRGYSVSPFYDSLLGKLIVWDEDRSSALRRLERALSELRISGIKTTQRLHLALVADPAVRAAEVHTNYLERWLESKPPSLFNQKELAGQ